MNEMPQPLRGQDTLKTNALKLQESPEHQEVIVARAETMLNRYGFVLTAFERVFKGPLHTEHTEAIRKIEAKPFLLFRNIHDGFYAYKNAEGKKTAATLPLVRQLTMDMASLPHAWKDVSSLLDPRDSLRIEHLAMDMRREVLSKKVGEVLANLNVSTLTRAQEKNLRAFESALKQTNLVRGEIEELVAGQSRDAARAALNTYKTAVTHAESTWRGFRKALSDESEGLTILRSEDREENLRAAEESERATRETLENLAAFLQNGSGERAAQ